MIGGQSTARSKARRDALRSLALAGAAGAGSMALLIRAALAVDPATGMRSINGTVTVDGRPASISQTIGFGQIVVTQ